MSMMLWKTLALGGVIGVGGVVVVQAQRSLDTETKTAIEEYPLLEGELDLETDLVDDKATPAAFPGDAGAQPLALADGDLTALKGDPLQPTPADEMLAASGGSPFDAPSPAPAPEVATASAEFGGDGDPFAPTPGAAQQKEPEETGTASVTLDAPAGDQVALLNEPAAFAPANAGPITDFGGDPQPAAGDKLKKLSEGNDGPVLMRTPTTEAPAAAEAGAPDDNPFARFMRPPAAAAVVPAADPAEFAPAPGPNVEPAAAEAPPRSLTFPPLRTREEPKASPELDFDLPPATLDPQKAAELRSRREPVPAAQAEPAVASEQDAGLAAPAPPAFPDVSPENAPGRMRVAEADASPLSSIPPQTEPSAFDGASLEMTAGDDQRNRTRTMPADGSSIPFSGTSIPQGGSSLPPGGSSIPFDPSIPSGESSIPAGKTPPVESSIPRDGNHVIPNEAPMPAGSATINLDETSAGGATSLPPAGSPDFGAFPPAGNGAGPANNSSMPSNGSSIPLNARPADPSPFDAFPPAAPGGPAEQPVPAPISPAPATTPDLSGMGTLPPSTATGPSQPQLTIHKQAPTEAVIGQDVEYTIIVRNIGRSAAQNVVVEDLIPRGSRCTGTIPKAETQLEKKNLVWKLGTLAPGAEQQIRVRIVPTDAGEIGSVATVSFTAEVAAKTVIVEPKAEFVVTGPKDTVIGEPTQYRFTLKNTGPVDLKGVVVRTILPPKGLTHPHGSDLEYEVGDLPRGATRDVSLALTPSEAGDWKFQSLVTLRGRELAQSVTDLHVVGARLTVVRSGPKKRFVGKSATYSNTVTNNSAQTLFNIAVTESLPPGLDPAGQLGNARWDVGRRLLSWTIPQLAPGESIDLPVTVLPKTAGALEGQVVARDSAGNQAELPTALEVAGFSSLVVDGGHDGRPVAVGDQVSFRFTVKNRGTAPADQVQAMFELPEEVEFVSAQGPANSKYEVTGRVITFDAIPSVPVGSELAYDVMVTAKAVTPTAGDHRIRVSLFSNQLPADRPLEQEQQLVIYGDDEEPQPVQRVSGIR